MHPYHRGMRTLQTEGASDSRGNGEDLTLRELTACLATKEMTADQLAAAASQATQTAADSIVEQLLHDKQRMLEEHYGLREGFEQRIVEVWGPALDFYQAVYTCCLEAGEEYCNRVVRHARGENDLRFEALLLQHARACMVASEIHGLLRTGHAVGAQARWRTLHEIVVASTLLGEGDQVLARRFFDHRAIERYKDAEDYQEHCSALGYEPLSAEEFEPIREAYQRAIDDHEKGFSKEWGWARPSLAGADPHFAALARQAGFAHMRPWYMLATRGTHSGVTGALHVRDLHGRGTVMLAGPSNAGLADPGHAALLSLYQVTMTFILHGSTIPTNADDIALVLAIRRLVDAAGHEFLSAHHDLEAREATTADDPGQGDDAAPSPDDCA